METEGWRRGGEVKKKREAFRKIIALSPTGCKSLIEYGGGALEQLKPSPLSGCKEPKILRGGTLEQ